MEGGFVGTDVLPYEILGVLLAIAEPFYKVAGRFVTQYDVAVMFAVVGDLTGPHTLDWPMTYGCHSSTSRILITV